ncbi:DUF3102 domain-containing protein [Pseudomonas aeruginosa]|uniref:DUF3102 domain-containing protein n=1 Tax=Pseudomonas aeruginosa TaxID=287 RepID=UPI001E56DDA3|nr:DUF3102 domain-containing protein [Pseudomonas aeruginosa]MCD2761370.1 DUF3102 domain-containing protein [Pseudomonas aeruginosa]HBP0991514.1 hypothetical protein [Pseudomonas aeruginosa]HBP1202109.1 hypothetical protein [Pseudomonas aeruginosa]
MARKPSTEVELVEDDAQQGQALLATQQQLATLTSEHEHQVRAVAAQLGYQLPADCTDPDLIQRDIAANMRRSVEACLEVGRALQVLKAATPHGEFIDRLDSLGLDRKVAVKFMTSAAKFASLGSDSALTRALGNQSKLFEMLVLDDEEIQELELTGRTGELRLDDVATMSVKELRKALRESRETLSAKERVMADITAKNNQLATELAKKPKVILVQPIEEAKQLRQEVVATAYEVEGTLQGTLRKAFADLEQLAQQTGEDHRGFKAALVRNLEVTLMAIRSEFHLPELHPDQLPGWQNLLGLDDLAEG